MKQGNISSLQKWKRGIYVLVSALLIVAFLPQEHIVKYDYSVDKPWKYGQIIADYDFPIYKSEKAYQAERDSVMRSFQPYYRVVGNIKDVQCGNFQRDINNGEIKGVSGSYVAHVLQKLQEVYEVGIMDSHDYTMLQDSGFAFVRMIKGSTSFSRPVGKLYTVRTAYLYIVESADSLHLNKEILSHCNIHDYIAPNLVYDKVKSAASKKDLSSSVSYAKGMVQKGEKIIGRGDIVTADNVDIIESLMKESERRNDNSSGFWLQILGKFMLAYMLLMAFYTYLLLYRKDYFLSFRHMSLLYFFITMFPIVISLVYQNNVQYVFYVPITAVAIIVSVFMDSRTSFLTSFVTIILSSLALQEPYLFIFTQSFSAIVAIYSLKELASRSQLIYSAFLITAITCLLMLGIELSQGHSLNMLDTSWYVAQGVNGVLLLFTYPFLFVIERSFGFTSSITLVELSNISHPLLRELSKQAQGTFNHSMQVANLASEIAAKTGADVLLVRTGALYHDIGKIKNPTYFTENQGANNPHDNIPEERSAQIILQHIADGMDLAEKYSLPKVIKEFIQTHHGMGKVGYFYIQYRNNHPNEQVDEALFTYPGPNPYTKEQGILMLADSVEAASRSLKTVDDESIRKLVDNIVDSKMKEGFFESCPLTFYDVHQAKAVLVSSLKTIYHTRVSYPTLNTPSNKNKKRKNRFFNRR